ncbi:MAG: hypothetical protein ACI4IK_07835 [Eubacterium sp.]
MDGKKRMKRNRIFFIITVCCFVIAFVFLLTVIILAPVFTMDQGSMNFLELLGECIRYFAVAIPYYLSAVIYAIDCKKVTELSTDSNNRFFKVSKVVNIVMTTVITIMITATAGRIYYWS